MKKQQKIIELRTAAKLKVSELETKIAVARSEAAGERSRLMWERAAELDGLEAGSTERYDVLAKYRAKLAGVNETLEATVAQCKYEIQQAKTECERQCAAAEDDPEPAKEQPQQETVYCDGSEHSARIVARRIINKMPHVPAGGYLFAHVHADNYGEYFVCVTAGASRVSGNVYELFSVENHTAETEAAFVERVRELFGSEIGNSHVAEQVDNLISDTLKDGKEGKNE